MKTLGSRLLIGFSFLLVMLVVSAIGLNRSFMHEKEIVRRSSVAAATLENHRDQLQLLTADLQRLALEAALEGSDEKLLQAGAKASNFFEVADRVIVDLGKEPEYLLRDQRITQMRSVTESFREVMRETLSALAGYIELGETIDFSVMAAGTAKFRKELELFQQLEQQARRAELMRSGEQFDHALEQNRRWQLITLVVMALVFIFIRRGIVLRTTDLARFVGAAAENPLQIKKRAIVSGEDEVTKLAREINSLFDRLQDSAVSKDFFNRIVENIGNALFVTDSKGVIQLVNAMAIDLTGLARGDIVGQSLERFLGCAAIIGDEFEPDKECELNGAETIPVACIRSEMDDGYIFVVIDLRERNAAQAQLRLAAKVIDTTVQGVVITNASGIIVVVNPAFTELTGYSREEAVGNTPSLLKSGRHDAEFYAGIWHAVANDGSWQGEVWNKRKSGEIYPELLSLSAVRNSRDQITHYVALFSDITERKNQEQKIEFLAFHDSLTGLPNRRLLKERLEQVVLRCKRQRESFALMFLDLDRFKPVNDTLGHDIGDLLLKDVAKRLRACVPRESDTVSRIGGDEFVILLSHIEKVNDAVVVAEKVMQALTHPFVIGEHAIEISTSIGIALYPQHGDSAVAMTKSADTAMYHTKHSGRNGYRIYDAGMEGGVVGRPEPAIP